MKRHNFTLIEMLVVGGCLSLALLLPALSTARERGRVASCISNLKQISWREIMYADENDGYRVTPAEFSTGEYIGNQIDMLDTRSIKNKFYGNYPASKLILWGYSLEDNSKITAENKAVFRCPSDELYNEKSTVISYFDVIFTKNKPTAAARYNYNEVANPGKVTIWFDQHVNLGTVFTNHQNKVNAVYMDGHVKSITMAADKCFNVETQSGDGWNFLDNSIF